MRGWLVDAVAKARHKPVEKLTRAECYAYGYDCTSCSGELEHIAIHAQACLDAILEKDPKDATAWALKSAVHGNQWRFGHGLPEPERSDLLLRRERTDMVWLIDFAGDASFSSRRARRNATEIFRNAVYQCATRAAKR